MRAQSRNATSAQARKVEARRDTAPLGRGYGGAGVPGIHKVLLSASVSAAMDCSGNEDCPKGWICSAGEDASPACSPGSCAEHSDCASGMRCYEWLQGSCEDQPPCPVGSSCPQPDPDCDESLSTLCLPMWTVPCSEDQDCGEGFECATERCSCATASGDSEPECSCEPRGEGRCELLTESCEEDADCLDEARCEDHACQRPYEEALHSADLSASDGSGLSSAATAEDGDGDGDGAGDGAGDGGCQMSPSGVAIADWRFGLCAALGLWLRRRRP